MNEDRRALRPSSEAVYDAELEREELIAYILSCSVPIERAADAALNLSQRYQTVTEILSEDPEELRRTPGVCVDAVAALKAAYSIQVRAARETLHRYDFSENFGVLRNYCECQFQSPIVRVLKPFYFRHGRLVQEGAIETGGLEDVSISPREIVKTAISIDANQVFLAFGRKFGDQTLLASECEQTERLRRACEALDISCLGSMAVVTRGPGLRAL